MGEYAEYALESSMWFMDAHWGNDFDEEDLEDYENVCFRRSNKGKQPTNLGQLLLRKQKPITFDNLFGGQGQ